MRVATGTVVSGKVVFDDSVIADGTDVYVLSRDAAETPRLSPEELAELEAGIAEADRGEMISGEEFFRQLPEEPKERLAVLELGLREWRIRRALESYRQGVGSLAFAAYQSGISLREMIPLAYAHGLEPKTEPADLGAALSTQMKGTRKKKLQEETPAAPVPDAPVE